MTYIPFSEIKTSFTDSSDLDAFARLRTSNPQTLFESQLQYDDMPNIWETVLTGNADRNHIDNESSCHLEVFDTGDKIIRQTYEYFRYQPGKSLFVALTAVLGTYNSNIVRRIGYFDDDNGLFFQMTDGMSVGIRSSTSGTAVDSVVSQSNWNKDKLDGTGPSGLTLDFTKANLFVIDFQWLGVGRVRFGVMIGGRTIYFHEQNHGGTIDKVYMRTATLPCRYEMESLSGVGSMKQICTTVIAEGGFRQKGFVRAVDTGDNGVTVNAGMQTVLSIRVDPSRPRATLYPKNMSILQTSNNAIVHYQIIVRHTPDNTMTWNDVLPVGSSAVQYSTTSTTVTGGAVVDSGYIQSRTEGILGQAFEELLPISSNYAGEPFILSLMCSAIGGNIPIYASLQFREIF